jgi:hypothetical protein
MFNDYELLVTIPSPALTTGIINNSRGTSELLVPRPLSVVS